MKSLVAQSELLSGILPGLNLSGFDYIALHYDCLTTSHCKSVSFARSAVSTICLQTELAAYVQLEFLLELYHCLGSGFNLVIKTKNMVHYLNTG